MIFYASAYDAMEYIVHSTWVGEFDDNREQIIRTQIDRGTF